MPGILWKSSCFCPSGDVNNPCPHRGMCNCSFKQLSVLHLLGFGLESASLAPHGGFVSPSEEGEAVEDTRPLS